MNECLLYRGAHADDDECAVCGEPRFEEDVEDRKRERNVQSGMAVEENMSINDKKKKYHARYVYLYCPLIPRLKMLIAHPVMSRLLQYGDAHMINADSNVCDDIHQSPAYHRFAKQFPLKSEDPVNGVCDMRIAFGIGADRASMSKHKMRNDFAILPILGNIVNFPIWFRNQEKHLLLLGLPPLQSHNPSLFFP